MIGCLGARAQDALRQAVPCGGDVVVRGIAASRPIDGRTFALADGREVRLVAIEVPSLAADQARESTPGATARDALAAELKRGKLSLRQAETQADRYGRILAYAYVAGDGGERSVQADLVAAGMARVAASVGSRACAAELLRQESAARRAKLGLWASSYYDSLRAEDPAAVLAAKGRFALVEGKVDSVRESGAIIYVNFGRRWTEDFTVTILKRNERSFTAAGLEPRTLAGRRIRVRGWIEERGGPWIEAARPEQIELADRE
jgi:endonuclease YncB( thermonuclease family)